MNDFLAGRADFGFGNPNLAGALFAMLALAVWVRWNRRGESDGLRALGFGGFLVRLAASGIFSGLMVMTASRGAIVALAAGALAFWAAGGFLRPRVRTLAGLAGVALALVGFSALGRMGERVVESSMDDGSITSRVEIFRAVPEMLAAAPQGWGWGQSAEAYDLVWLNPPGRLDEAQRLGVERAEKKTIVWGDLRSDANPRKLKMWFSGLPDSEWIDARGQGLLVTDALGLPP